MDALRARIARRLERGDPSFAARMGADVYSMFAASRVARPLAIPDGLEVIGVGGAVLGGAGKTPVAIELARGLAEGRAEGSVALVGHAYRARPLRARVVAPNDRVEEVGDDALFAARSLERDDVAVVVAPSRADALRYARAIGRTTVVADGVLQTSPRRLALSLLVVDASAPWGSGACPPAGDLRAPLPALFSAADAVLAIGDAPVDAGPVPVLRARSQVVVPRLPPGDLGLLLGVARPERIERSLSALALRFAAVERFDDHARFGSLDRLARVPVAAWLTTARCATKLPREIGRALVVPIEHRVDVREAIRYAARP